MPSLLSQKAVLASIRISQWSARKVDKNATDEIHARNHAEPHAGRYNKLLIAREGLQKVQHVAGEARTFHYGMTQPWLDDGVLRWRLAAERSLHTAILADPDHPFSADGGLKLLTGNLGRAECSPAVGHPPDERGGVCVGLLE